MANVENRKEQLLDYQEQDYDEDYQEQPLSQHRPPHEGEIPQATRSSSVSSMHYWITECAWPGMGLFGESYLLFSIGTLKPLWQKLFPGCFDGDECTEALLQSLTYSVVLGVICGMVILGTLANSLGRRTGSILTASLMAGGSIGLTLVSWFLAFNPTLLFAGMSALLFIFGIGVGGEYPLSASSASERAMGEMRQAMKRKLEREANRTSAQDRGFDLPPTPVIELRREADQIPHPSPTHQQKRGQAVQLVFTMQGMGIMANSLILTFLLIAMGQFGGNGEYSSTSLMTIWRATYAFGAVILSLVLAGRICYLKESKVWQDDKRRRDELKRVIPTTPAQVATQPGGPLNSHFIMSEGSMVSSLSAPSVIADPMALREVPSTTAHQDLKSSKTSLLLRNYGLRLFGTSLSWLLWDIAFYGNKLFQSAFILALTGADSTLLQISGASTLNAFVALLGYFAAAAVIDHPRVGRLRLQQYGFLITGALFIGCGFLFDRLSPTWLTIMYLGSSFVGQCGPNATTFLIPAEIFPTEMRTMCHGISAAAGKLGALFAAIMFHRLRDVDLFMLSGYASFAACVVTVWTIPETTTLDLYESDRKWLMILEGRKGEYDGAANKPEYLSLYERNKRRHQYFYGAHHQTGGE